jgi:hypothetical protein
MGRLFGRAFLSKRGNPTGGPLCASMLKQSTGDDGMRISLPIPKGLSKGSRLVIYVLLLVTLISTVMTGLTNLVIWWFNKTGMAGVVFQAKADFLFSFTLFMYSLDVLVIFLIALIFSKEKRNEKNR